MNENCNHTSKSADDCPRCGLLLRELQQIMDQVEAWPKRKTVRKAVAP